MSYQDILDEKNESVKEASKFINFIKARFLNSHIISSKQGRLIALLESECELYLKLNRTNYAEISKKLSELKERSNVLVCCFLSHSLKNLPLRNLQIF